MVELLPRGSQREWEAVVGALEREGEVSSSKLEREGIPHDTLERTSMPTPPVAHSRSWQSRSSAVSPPPRKQARV